MNRVRSTLATVWLLAGCSAFGDTVEHPRAGERGSPAYCKFDSADENTCGACSAKPGCGWCEELRPGATSCQPGIRSDKQFPDCNVPLAIGEPECPAPPPLP